MIQSAFLQQMGDTPKNRVWNFLIVHSEYDYSMKEIAEHSQVGYTTLKKMWVQFKKQNIVTLTRQVGKAKMYALNRSNPIVEKFTEYYWAVVDSTVKKDQLVVA